MRETLEVRLDPRRHGGLHDPVYVRLLLGRRNLHLLPVLEMAIQHRQFAGRNRLRNRPGSDVPLGVNEMRLRPSGSGWPTWRSVLMLSPSGFHDFGNTSNASTPGPTTASPTSSATTTGCSTGGCRKIADAKPMAVLGDSVVWGEYVKSDGTLPHFLNQQAGRPIASSTPGSTACFPWHWKDWCGTTAQHCATAR